MEHRQAHADARLPAVTGALLTLLNMLQFAFTLLWTAGWITVSLSLQLATGRPERALLMARSCWAPWLIGAAGGLTVDGAEAIDWTRPYLVVANHESILDICVMFRAVPVPLRFLLKDEMRRVPFVNWYARATGMLFISRDDRRSGPLLRRQAAGVLGAGQALCLFPEGTRARDGRLAAFKSGSFQAAIDAGVEILPIAIHGTGAVLPAESFFRARRGPMRATIGRPLSTTDCVGAAGRQALARRAQDAVAAMLAGR